MKAAKQDGHLHTCNITKGPRKTQFYIQYLPDVNTILIMSCLFRAHLATVNTTDITEGESQSILCVQIKTLDYMYHILIFLSNSQNRLKGNKKLISRCFTFTKNDTASKYLLA